MFWLHSYPEGSNVSRFETFKQVEKSTGRTPPELLKGPELSSGLHYLWDVYSKLTEFTHTEIAHFINLTGQDLEAWEVKAIVKLAKYREATPKWPLN